MNTYFRAQRKGNTFDDMKAFISADGGDELQIVGGICACITVQDLLNNTVLDAMNDDDDVVIFTGMELAEIYDGFRVLPVRELARVTVGEFIDNAAELSEKYEWM